MRQTPRQFAEKVGVKEATVRAWLRNAMKPESERNKSLPPIIARRMGRQWQIAVEKTELAMSLCCGNPTEKALVKRGMIL